MSTSDVRDLSNDRRGAEEYVRAMACLRSAEAILNKRSSNSEGSVADGPKAGGGGGL